MIEPFPNHGEDNELLPREPVNLAVRMREIRARQGLKQSEIARRMGLDPSIPSLWEQGKRPVPVSRINALATALGVSVGELLDGAGESLETVRSSGRAARYAFSARDSSDHGYRDRTSLLDRHPYLTLVSAQDAEPAPPRPRTPLLPPIEPVVFKKRFTPTVRPAIEGFIPEGWQPSERVQDISVSLPDGYWLDPLRLEKSTARDLLRARLDPADQAAIAHQDVPGIVLVERLHQKYQRDGLPTARLPLMEIVFRLVVAADHGGLAVDALLALLQDRAEASHVKESLLRRLGDALHPYPLRWVDRELFGE